MVVSYVEGGGSLRNIFADFTAYIYQLLLIGVVITGVIVLLNIFIKSKSALIVIAVLLVIGSFFYINQLKYITFHELFSEHVNEDSEVRSVTIEVSDLSRDRPEAR